MTVRTHRIADGVRIEGVSRPIFIHNIDTYYLADLLIYADGLIDCWGPTDLAGLREHLESGWVATTVEEGAMASADGLGWWRFGVGEVGIDAENLLGEVADEIDRLNDRPDSSGRCLQALEAFLAERTETNQAELLRRYLAIPEHFRNYVLGDMDRQDQPLRVLATPVGQRTPHPDDDEPVTIGMHEEAFEYFAERETDAIDAAQRVPADGPERPVDATVSVPAVIRWGDWPQDPGFAVHQTYFPAEIEADGRRYPSVEHAYWALSTSDDEVRAAIAALENPFQADGLAEAAPRIGNWHLIRQAVMLRLLRAKYARHSKLRELLLSTGDGMIAVVGHGSKYWGSQGPNWLGRLLEVVRSELALEQAEQRAQHV